MLVEMQNICKDYIQGKDKIPVLKNICLQVEEGDYLAIMGPSGSGKTTLMNLLGCLDVPTAGTYYLAGEDMGKAKDLAKVRNRTLGFVFQSFHLLPKLTAVDNVALPLMYAGVPKKERRRRAIEALEKMGLGDRLEFRPNQLSGGQCQRIAIARAIVGEPRLLLADEPTGALDTASGSQIMDIFDRLNAAGATIIMITHEQEVANRAKRICYIRDGILTGGSVEQPWEEHTGTLPVITEEMLSAQQDGTENAEEERDDPEATLYAEGYDTEAEAWDASDEQMAVYMQEAATLDEAVPEQENTELSQTQDWAEQLPVEDAGATTELRFSYEDSMSADKASEEAVASTPEVAEETVTSTPEVAEEVETTTPIPAEETETALPEVAEETAFYELFEEAADEADGDDGVKPVSGDGNDALFTQFLEELLKKKGGKDDG